MPVTESIFKSANTTLALIKTWLGGDDMSNFEPIHDPLTELDAAHLNKDRAGLAECALRIRKGLLVPLHFYIADTPASQTDQELSPESQDANKSAIVMPFGGSVVALVAHTENARTAGQLTLNWRDGGTKQTLAAVIDGTNTQKVRSYQLPGVETFAALAELDLVYTTDASWAAGVTPSLWGTLWVSMGEEETGI